MNDTKIIANGEGNSSELLFCMNDWMNRVRLIRNALEPYDPKGGVTVPYFLTHTSAQLKGNVVESFGNAYTCIKNLVSDGMAGNTASNRLNDAIYKFAALQEELVRRKFVVKSDEDRRPLMDKANVILGDQIVFICTQFGLSNMANGVQQCVPEFCGKFGITPDFFYGQLLSELEEVGQEAYVYEEMNPLYEAMMACDAVFMSECEENNYPLTSALAEKILDGTESLASARNQLVTHMVLSSEKEIDMSPAQLISRMNLK